MDEHLADLRDQLANVSESLGDRILDALHEAVQQGATKRPPNERLLTRARTSVDKAISLLDQADALDE